MSTVASSLMCLRILRKCILLHLRNWMPTPPFEGSNTTGARANVTFLALGPSARICRMKGVTGLSCCAIVVLFYELAVPIAKSSNYYSTTISHPIHLLAPGGIHHFVPNRMFWQFTVFHAGYKIPKRHEIVCKSTTPGSFLF